MVDVRALTFDVGGTVLDWHSSIKDELESVGRRLGIEADWGRFTNRWRRVALETMINENKGRAAGMNIDGVHRMVLDEVLNEFGIDKFTAEHKEDLTMAWHRLRPWSDAVVGLARLRKKFIVCTLTILSVSLVVDVSRSAGFTWDCVLSCEMIGKYKPHPAVYSSPIKYLGLEPNQILMVACHNFDLLGAKKCGLKAAYVPRPKEWGSRDMVDETSDPMADERPDPSVDIVAKDFIDLAEKLGA